MSKFLFAEESIDVAVSLEGVPVSSGNRISSMMAPLLTYSNTMQFVLSPKYKKLSEVPIPTDPHVKIRKIPKRVVAVTSYYGWISPFLSKQTYDWLCRALLNDRLMTQSSRHPHAALGDGLQSESSTEAMDAVDRDTTPTLTSPYYVAQYHPPYALPCFRQVEVWVPLDPTNVRLLEMIRGYYDFTYRSVSYFKVHVHTVTLNVLHMYMTQIPQCPQGYGHTNGRQLSRRSVWPRIRLRRCGRREPRTGSTNVGVNQTRCEEGGALRREVS